MKSRTKQKTAKVLLFMILFSSVATACTRTPGTSPAPVESASGSPTASAAPVSSAPVMTPEPEPPVEEVVLLASKGDINADGQSEQIRLIRLTNDIYRLSVSGVISGAEKEWSRDLAGPGTNHDFPNVEQVYGIQVVRITAETPSEMAIVLQFENFSIGDTQLAVYRISLTEGIVLETTEPYAIDTGIVTLTDPDLDGVFEKTVEKDYVTAFYRYKRSGSLLTSEFVRALPKVEFDLTLPESVIRSYMYRRFNQITEGMDRLLLDDVVEPDSIFVPFESDTGEYLGVAYTDASRNMYMGMPSQNIELVETTSSVAIYRVSDTSDFSDRHVVSMLFHLERQANDMWKIKVIENETPVFICHATDKDNKMVLTYVPVFLSAADEKSGSKPVIAKLKELTGIELYTIGIDGDRCEVVLAPGMENYINQGSTGARMKMESLVRTLLGLPGVMEAEILTASLERAEMDHYSLDGIFSLTDDNQIRMDPWSALPELPNQLEDAAAFVMSALREQDFVSLARIHDAQEGLRLSIRGRVRPDSDPVFNRLGLLSFYYDQTVQVFFKPKDGAGVRASKRTLFNTFFLVDAAPELCEIVPYPVTGAQQTDENPGNVIPDAEKPETVYPDEKMFQITIYDSTGKDRKPIRQIVLVFSGKSGNYRLAAMVSGESGN